MKQSEFFNGIRSLDHPVLAVRDLAAARQVCERLGFTVPPRGSHVEWGTGNLCIMFPDDYLELRGIIDPDRPTLDLEAHLDRFGEGLMGIALGTADVAGSRQEMRRRGIGVGPVRRLTRNFEHPEGWTQPSFALCLPETAAIEGLMHVVVLEHLTPELIRRPEFLSHSNGCVGVDGVAGVIHDVEATAERMARLFGPGAVTADEEGSRMTLPTGQRIDLLRPDSFRRRFGPPGSPAAANASRLGAMRLRVGSLARCRDWLAGKRVEFTEPAAGIVRVAPAWACGTIIDFAESDSRGNPV